MGCVSNITSKIAAAALTGGNCAISASSDAMEVVVIAILRALPVEILRLRVLTYRRGITKKFKFHKWF